MGIQFISLNRQEFLSIGPRDAVMHSGDLTPRELTFFFKLIQKRRPLPVYHGDYWSCQLCSFKCRDIEFMARHMIDEHEPEPYNEEDWSEEYQDPYLAGLLNKH
jgi:hypothetical protein